MAVSDAPYVRVPDENEFEDEGDYLSAPELEDLLTEIVGKYPALNAIEEHGLSVACLWKRKGGKSKGRPTLGRTQIPSGLLAHFCPADVVIWLAADHVKAQEWTTETVAKLLYHYARWIGWEDGKEDEDGNLGEGRPIMLAPDLQVFAGEIRDTGTWDHIRTRAASDFSQPGLGL